MSGLIDMLRTLLRLDDPEYQEVRADLVKRMDQWFEEIDKPPALFENAGN